MKKIAGEELFNVNKKPRWYDRSANEAAFLLGGIGTGNISIGSRGQFRDWEIFNSPGKGNNNIHSFFSIWQKQEGKDPVAKVIEGEINPPFSDSHGLSSAYVSGLPRFQNSRISSRYPFATVEFTDDSIELDVKMEAFTPFIPLNAEDSSIPGAVIRYYVTNTSDKAAEVSVVGSFGNPVCLGKGIKFGMPERKNNGENKYIEEGGTKGLSFCSKDIQADARDYGEFSFITAEKNVTYKENWMSGQWFDHTQDFWNDFCEDGLLEPHSGYESVGSNLSPDIKKHNISSMGVKHMLAAGETKKFEFIISWYFPNRMNAWKEDKKEECCCGPGCCENNTRNHYATIHESAWAAGEYLLTDLDRLESQSRMFADALYASSLPDYVIDALANNITVLRSTTCFRLENGAFAAWEGCHDGAGCCPGSCTHVWNYAQTIAFLFPELEQSMRKTEYLLETDDKGAMMFRTYKVFNENADSWDFIPASDGQMGTIVRLYREWLFSGNDELLKEVWPKLCLSLDYAFNNWDSDGDGMLDAQQHNTYDIEFYGPNMLSSSMFLAALKAASKMAEYLSDGEHFEKYNTAFEKGKALADEKMFNGEYYVQLIENVNKYRYQYGKGCLSDQLFGQFLANITCMGHILPEEHVKKAMHSIYRYNFMESFRNHHNVQRTYALNDEQGLVLCSWPEGERPRFPFVYADEVWTGIEYQVAANLIYEGYVEEGLTVVKAVDERHDGYKRSPWNQVECGHHYARSLASWGLLTALSGYSYDNEGNIGFDPKINREDFRAFFSTSKAWGIYTQNKNPKSGEWVKKIEVLYGDGSSVKLEE